ncbi:MAG TPA: glutathione S-transferase [Janthinobacterium sp.]|nr:glutathione S-transferase [Janthinobacterium sp.]
MIHVPALNAQLAAPAKPIVLYGFALSGHTHRVELLLRMMELPYTHVRLDLGKAEQKSLAFLRMNPFGQVPVIDDDGAVLWDSAAILEYLASKYGDGRFLPADPAGRAAVQRWLSVAAGVVVNGPMAARVGMLFKRPVNIEQAHAVARQLFTVMERFLADEPYLAARRLTIADLAMYPYIAHAPEGGIDLAPYPQLRGWLERIEAAPGFIAMARSKTGLWAE